MTKGYYLLPSKANSNPFDEKYSHEGDNYKDATHVSLDLQCGMRICNLIKKIGSLKKRNWKFHSGTKLENNLISKTNKIIKIRQQECKNKRSQKQLKEKKNITLQLNLLSQNKSSCSPSALADPFLLLRYVYFSASHHSIRHQVLMLTFSLVQSWLYTGYFR